jgi:16S rRNA (uracil1498-N3)-methyltransferase
MHRFHLPPELCRDDLLVLSETEAHHAVNVLRLKAGERAVVLDGAGQELLCDIREAQRNHVVLSVKQRIKHPPLPCQITLLQAIPKGKNMDLIVQKAAELGAWRVVPILSERTVTQVEEEAADAKVAKYQATAVETIKQCGSPWLTQIERPVTPAAFLARNDRFELPLVASLQPGSRHPREQFDHFAAERGRRPKSIGVWVGPEGDFTPAEINAIRGSGAFPITLGQLVLRSETAAIYCLSVLNYELQSPPNG